MTTIFNLFSFSSDTPTQVTQPTQVAQVIQPTQVTQVTQDIVPEAPLLLSSIYTTPFPVANVLTDHEVSISKLKLLNTTRIINYDLNKSWLYVSKFIKSNPRPFDDKKLQKFKEVIFDPEFPPIRQKFKLVEEEEEEEEVSKLEVNKYNYKSLFNQLNLTHLVDTEFIETVKVVGVCLGSYFLFLNVFVNIARYATNTPNFK